MTNRRIHPIDRMIAIHHGGKVLAVFPDAFAELTEKLLPELTQFERISFKSAAAPVALFVNREHIPLIPKWELLFIDRLRQNIVKVGHLLSFTRR